MAETSAALCFSPFTSLFSFIRAKDSSFSSFSTDFPPKSPNSHPCPSRLLRFPAKSSSDSSNSLPDDLFGFFPWSNDSEKIEWVPEERVTLFTSDGLIQIGGSMVPRRLTSSNKKQGQSKTNQRSQRFKESDYMDTEQGLCLGALFDIAATNGLDTGRRLCIFGFCRSIEMLSDVVEDTVLEHGGEVVAAEKAMKGGLQEKLRMTVAVPLLWGVPPAAETLHLAVKSGGGIVGISYKKNKRLASLPYHYLCMLYIILFYSKSNQPSPVSYHYLATLNNSSIRKLMESGLHGALSLWRFVLIIQCHIQRKFYVALCQWTGFARLQCI